MGVVVVERAEEEGGRAAEEGGGAEEEGWGGTRRWWLPSAARGVFVCVCVRVCVCARAYMCMCTCACLCWALSSIERSGWMVRGKENERERKREGDST